MHRFWNRYSGPLVEAIAPRRILEIGAEFGWNTRHLLEYCRRNSAFLDIIEPVPHEWLYAELEPYDGTHYALHIAKSRECISRLQSHDLVMLDGDHNWRTVYGELTLLKSQAEAAGQPMPIVIAHDCSWPYARRDMYYNPSDFHESERHPYAYNGMRPGVSELVDDGINVPFANALMEGGPQNGVLTAIEDFVAANEGIQLWTLPFFNGLGILIPEARLTPAVDNVIQRIYSRDTLLEACAGLEIDTINLRIELSSTHRLLEQRTEALQRARDLLRARAERIADLEARISQDA